MAVKKEGRVFERLQALTSKGYVADFTTDHASGGIQLRHAGQAPDLILHPDGSIQNISPDLLPDPEAEDSGMIAARTQADDRRFALFIEAVQRPSWRQRTKRWRRKFLYTPGCLLIFWAMMLLFTVFLVNM